MRSVPVKRRMVAAMRRLRFERGACLHPNGLLGLRSGQSGSPRKMRVTAALGKRSCIDTMSASEIVCDLLYIVLRVVLPRNT